MQGLLIDHLVERAEGEKTCFSLTCTVCGTVWKSVSLPDMNRKSAAAEAGKQAYMCPFCGRPVCKNCFVDVDGISLCAQCGQRLRKRIEASFTANP